MKSQPFFLAVADGQRARFYWLRGPGKPLERHGFDMEAGDNPPSREQGTDRPGRSFESVGGARHAYSGRDFHAQAETGFARRVAGFLNQMAAEDKSLRLVLVAAPQTLGAIRPQLSDAAQGRLHAALAKDLTRAPEQELARHLTDVLPVA